MFEGCDPWPENKQLVELLTPQGVVDLHNWASFEGFSFRLPETLILRFEYDPSWGGLRDDPGSQRLQLRFEGVRDLLVRTVESEGGYESDTLSDFVYREVRPGVGSVTFTMMDGLTIQFEAGGVILEEI